MMRISTVEIDVQQPLHAHIPIVHWRKDDGIAHDKPTVLPCTIYMMVIVSVDSTDLLRILLRGVMVDWAALVHRAYMLIDKSA